MIVGLYGLVMDVCGNVLKKRHHIIQTFPRTGKRGRPLKTQIGGSSATTLWSSC